MYNFTLVTAMLDIGRGNWSSHQKRSYNTYLLYMQRVLRLDVNMVIFIESKGRPFVDWMRRGRERQTRVVEITLEELPYYRYRDRMKEIMDSEEYKKDNELVRKNLCEASIPEYDILQWSKLYFLQEAISANPFQDSYFIWLDGGYGRGEDIHPSDGVWKPTQLFQEADKVTFLERESVEPYRRHAARLHKMSINIVAGGFIAGGSRALERLYELQQKLIEEWMREGVVDDDQTIYMQLYFRYPRLFNFVRADWYDAFKLFDARKRL
nr:hypothetical protein BaRGS_034098 [Batillaria attramentaria]